MRYTARKILTLLVTMLVVSLLTFAAFDMISGDPAATLLGTQATPEKVEALRTEMGLNRPMLVRYGEWLAGFFTGNLGVSFQYRQPVQALLGPKMLVTLCLSLVSFVLIVVVSLPLGIAVCQRKAGGAPHGPEPVLHGGAAVLYRYPHFLVSSAFSLRVFVPGDFPGLDKNLGKSLVYLFFAAVSIAIPRVAMTVRMLRSTVISEMNKPYVRTAIARGNDRRQVLWGHVLKNSLVPTVTFLGQTMAEIVAGSIVVEQVFSIPGLGRMLVASISSQDYPVVEAIVVILAFWVVLSGTLADLVNRCVDPRMGGIGQMKKRNPYLTAGLVMTGILTALIVHGRFLDALRPQRHGGGPQAGGSLPGPPHGHRRLRPGHFQPGPEGGRDHLRHRPVHRGHRRGVRHGAGGRHRLLRRHCGRCAHAAGGCADGISQYSAGTGGHQPAGPRQDRGTSSSPWGWCSFPALPGWPGAPTPPSGRSTM